MSALGTDAAPRSWIAGRLEEAPGPLVFVTVGLAYLGLAQVVMWLNDPVAHGASVWPAAGLSLGVLMLLPTSRWAWAVGAIAMAELAGDLAWGYTAGVSMGWALSNTTEPRLGAYLLRRFGNPRGELARHALAHVIEAKEVVALAHRVLVPSDAGRHGRLHARAVPLRRADGPCRDDQSHKEISSPFLPDIRSLWVFLSRYPEQRRAR